MGAVIADGKALASEIEQDVARECVGLKESGIVPHLSVVIVGEDPARRVYVRNKQRACERCGIKSTLIEMPQDSSQEEIISTVEELHSDASVHGILVQSPIPGEVE